MEADSSRQSAVSGKKPAGEQKTEYRIKIPASPKHLLFVVGLFVLPFLFYWKLFAWNPDARQIFRGDFLNQHYVWKSYSLDRIKQGELPLWNPHVLGGVAMHANPQVGVFYPPNVALLPFHSDGRVNYMALEALQLLHLFLAGFGMWLFLRALGLRTVAAWTGAAIVMFTGFFTTPGHHAIVLTAGWIPLNLYLAGRAVTLGGNRNIALSAGGICLMLLAGHPQPAYYGLLLISAWALAAGGWRAALRRYVPAVVLALFMAMVQLLPTYQLARDSYRDAAGYEYTATFAFSPYFLPGALAPRGQIPLAGQDASTPFHIYVGIGTLLLAATALGCSHYRARWFFAGAAVVALLLSFGSFSFLFDMAYSLLPGFKSFRVPYRLLGLYAVSMSVLAAMGMDALSRATKRFRPRLKYLLQVALGLAAVLALWSAYGHTRLLTDPGVLEPRQVERMISAVDWALVLVVLNTVVFSTLLFRPGRRWAPWVLVAILVVDLGGFVKDRGQHPYSTLVRSEERRVQQIARAQENRGRYVTGTNLESYSILHGTESAGGQDSLIDSRYETLLNRSMESANALSLLNVKFVVRPGSLKQVVWCGPRFPSPLPLLDIAPDLSPMTLRPMPPASVGNLRIHWNALESARTEASIQVNAYGFIRLEESPFEVTLPEGEKLEQIVVKVEGGSPVRLNHIELDGSPLGLISDFVDLGGIKVNLHCLPRTYFVAATPDPLDEPSVEDLECWTLLDRVRIKDPETGATFGGYFRGSAARIVSYEPERVEIETDSPREGYVVLADTLRPGWRAEVNGQLRPILRAQRTFRAVSVPAGLHRVVFSYRPTSLAAGGLLSAFGLLTTLGLAFYRSKAS